ncbi:MAG TPA: ABC transporter ATP-binding protein [Acidimicrobiales bacterium]|nr:ABC transporter ATP-binding protein [Acidimicrobiales bacterium]
MRDDVTALIEPGTRGPGDRRRPAHRRSSRSPRRDRKGKDKRGDLREIARCLRVLGLKGLVPRLAGVGVMALVAGLAQAGMLVIITECALGAAQGKRQVHVAGHSLSFWSAIACSVALLVVYGLSSVAGTFLNTSSTTLALKASQQTIVRSFFRADWSVQSGERLGHIQQLLSMNAGQVAGLIASIVRGLVAFLTLVSLLGVAVIVNPLAATAVLVVGAILSVVMRPFNKLTKAASRKLSSVSQATGTLATEYSRMTREFRVFGVQSRALAQLTSLVNQTAAVYRRSQRLAGLYTVVYQTIALAFVVGAIAVVGSHKIDNLGSVGAVLLLILRSLSSTSGILGTGQAIRSSQGFVEDAASDVVRYEAREQRNPPEVTVPDRFDVTFDHVSFTYGGEALALEDVSFSVPEGALVGVVGRSGSGKTTLSQILLGVRQPTSGSALIGNVHPSSLARTDGKSPIAFVPQDPLLLQGSIAYNISFFRDAPQEEIEEAARSAHLAPDIERMSMGYDTPVGEGGGGALSGGQRQRLAIARALLGRPRVIVLDEPTSALDVRSELLIRQTLSELRGHVTMIVISHRLATVENCDYLLVLSDGHLTDAGPRETVVNGEPFSRVSSTALIGTG